MCSFSYINSLNCRLSFNFHFCVTENPNKIDYRKLLHWRFVPNSSANALTLSLQHECYPSLSLSVCRPLSISLYRSRFLPLFSVSILIQTCITNMFTTPLVSGFSQHHWYVNSHNQLDKDRPLKRAISWFLDLTHLDTGVLEFEQ